MATPARHGDRVAFYVALDDELIFYRVDAANFSLTRDRSVRLPAAVQYAWGNPTLPVLYVAYSNRFTVADGDHHGLAAWRIDPASGRLAARISDIRLANRPTNITVDGSGRYLLTAYNAPSELTVHRLGADGSIGVAVAPARPIDCGIYPHQVRVAPGDRTVILSTRGNDATPTSPEDPGALKALWLGEDGRVADARSVAPGGGYGFGPRHVDFHPAKPWLYASIERQNQLMMFPLEDGLPRDEPAFVRSTLRRGPVPPVPRQVVGPIHVHPAGHVVYLGNRPEGTTVVGGRTVFAGGENTIAVFAIDPDTGEPTLLQSAEAEGLNCRTFAVHPSGRMLVTASVKQITVHDNGAFRLVPPILAVFAIADDGRLSLVRTYDIDAGDRSLFWCGMIGL
jgi:6-phosphogluconolactonase (cycloisomerase 2 family)